MQHKLERNTELLKKLGEPKELFQYFLALTEIPRVSGNVKPISEALIDFAKKHKIEVKTDKTGNILFRKQATKGNEDSVSVCLQAHMDMVGTKEPDYEFDFAKDPLNVFEKDGWLNAKSTTLGGDDGAGIAMILAAMTDKEAVHGPLEGLFTVDEEMLIVKMRKICIGSAGGSERKIELPLNQIEIPKEYDTKIELYLHGLLGGHTGCDIHEGRANSIKWLTRILLNCMESEFLIANFSSGHATNAIPNSGKVIVVLKSKDVENFKKKAEEMNEKIINEYKSIETKQPKLEMKTLDSNFEIKKVCDIQSGKKLLDLLLIIPHGVFRFSPDVTGLVESSQSCSICTIKESTAIIEILARSSVLSQVTLLDQELESICNLSSAKFIADKSSDFPPWAPIVHNNPLLDTMKSTFNELYQKQPEVYAIHAGLECACINIKYPEMISVSIGPQIYGAHSVDEKMSIQSFRETHKFLMKSLENLSKVKK
ncbi:aminoacyl-histidine dipeptidase [Anaeramoeba ignava]|uniref:Aminoacyl-histidine dipeptidase n=1 Tax=Anaeramoeba ignava TaxID=1746090 RepID=A0A9Q0LHK9_ANAIG|nr:aminoacyl-histidine dipeptidase [Anaeramoeba ignava]